MTEAVGTVSSWEVSHGLRLSIARFVARNWGREGSKMKCKYCKYYEFDRRIEACHGHGEVQIGKCTESGLLYGNLTLAETEGCPKFERWETKYNNGDVFVGDFKYGERTDKRAFCIISLQPEYAPAVYRVRDSRQSEYSVAEDWFDGMEKVLSGGKE